MFSSFLLIFLKKWGKHCNIILEPSLSNKWMCIYIVRNCNLEGVFFCETSNICVPAGFEVFAASSGIAHQLECDMYCNIIGKSSQNRLEYNLSTLNKILNMSKHTIIPSWQILISLKLQQKRLIAASVMVCVLVGKPIFSWNYHEYLFQTETYICLKHKLIFVWSRIVCCWNRNQYLF